MTFPRAYHTGFSHGKRLHTSQSTNGTKALKNDDCVFCFNSCMFLNIVWIYVLQGLTVERQLTLQRLNG